jgi:predicted dehydrogenase
MDNIRIGVVGVGSIAQTAHVPLLTRMPDFDLIGICDSQKASVASISQKYGIPVVSSDYEAFVRRDDLDAIVISTPTDTHHPIGMAALHSGKHVIIEKPMTRTSREAIELAKLAAKKDRTLMVGMNHRFRQDSTVLKSLIQHGELGAIFMVQAGWMNYQSSVQNWVRKRERSGGGVFIDLGIVMLDLILWLLDYPQVDRVSANMFHHKTRTVEDSATCYFRAGRETSVQLVVSWNAAIDRSEYYINLVGSKGSATLNPLRIFKYIAGTPVNVTPVLPESGANIFRRSYEHELRHFAGAIRGLHPVISSGDEAVMRMKIVDAAYRSAELGREVDAQ